MPGLLEILQAVLKLPPRNVLDDIGLAPTQVIGEYVLRWLDG